MPSTSSSQPSGDHGECEHDELSPVTRKSLNGEQGNEHSLSGEHRNGHSLSGEQGNEHSVSGEQRNGHSLSGEQGNEHSVSGEQGNEHSVCGEQRNGHSLIGEQGNEHSVSGEQGNGLSVSGEQGYKQARVTASTECTLPSVKQLSSKFIDIANARKVNKSISHCMCD
jgi:hypothetical protein